MTDTTPVSSSPKGKRRWPQLLLKLGLALVVLLVVVYFVATSSFFLKSVILPRVSHTLNASVTAGDASIHPFSAITLHDLKVQAVGKEPLLTVQEVRLHYHLWDIIGGNIHVDEVALVSPTIELVQDPDGSNNLDPILKALQGNPQTEPKPAPSTAPPKPLKVDLAKLTISHADIQQIKNYAGGRRDLVEVSNVNLTLNDLKNGATAKLQLDAGIRVENNPPSGTNGTLAATLNGNFNVALTSDLKPGPVNGSLDLTVSQAGGAFADFNACDVALACDITPTDIKQVALRFQKAGASLGELTVTGPFDANKLEGKLTVALSGIDRRLLNLVGAQSGIDFGTTTINSTNVIELAKAGAVISAAGQFNLNKLLVTRAGQTTPTLDFSAAYSVTADRTAQVATVNSLNLTATQNGASLLTAQLNSPMSLPLGGNAGNLGDAALNLTVANLSLADWKPFLGDAVTAGNVGVNLKVSSAQGGKQINFDLNTVVANLAVRAGSNDISQAEVRVAVQGQAAQLNQINLGKLQLQLLLQNQPAVTVSGSGTYDLAAGGADLSVKLEAALARLLAALPQPGVNVTSGDLVLVAHVTQKQKTQTVTGDVTLDKFAAQVGTSIFQDFGSQIHLDVAASPEQIQINKVTGSFTQNGNDGGGFEITGTAKPAQKSADVNVTLSNLNDHLLRPFLEPALAGKKLASVTVAGTIAAQYNPQAGSAVKANVQVSNLVVNDPAEKFPATPLAAGFSADASLNQQIAEVRQVQLTLTPTARANNQLTFSGRVDLTKPDAIQGNLKLAAEALDFTSYYDLFAGGTNAVTKAATPAPAPPSPSTGPEQEPAAVHTPLRDFTLAVDIGRIYLHEIAISNLLMTTKIDDSHVVVKPFQLTLNDAPINSTIDADLGLPGYKYNVGFDAQKIPLAPIVATFQPDRAGQIGGTMTANAQISGAGITGPSLKENLNGQYGLEITNLNLSVVNVRNKYLRIVINVVATLPQLLKSPESALSSLLSSATGQGGLMGDLEKSPIESVIVQGEAGSGKIGLKQALVQSSAFEVNAAGEVMLNSVLTNSTLKIPVTVSLSQKLAGQLNVASTNASGAYVALPPFLTMIGTVGDPKPDIDKLALAGTAAKALTGNLFKSSGTNSSPVEGILNKFFRKKK